jgi:hypothetical protein
MKNTGFVLLCLVLATRSVLAFENEPIFGLDAYQYLFGTRNKRPSILPPEVTHLGRISVPRDRLLDEILGADRFFGMLNEIPIIIYEDNSTPFRYILRQSCKGEEFGIQSAHLTNGGEVTLELENRQSLHGNRRETVYRGIPSIELAFPNAAILGRTGNLLLRASSDPKLAVTSDPGAQITCSDMGAYPSFIQVLFEPGSLPKLENWMKLYDAVWDDGQDKEVDNLRIISVTVGQEVKQLRRLRKEPWVIEASLLDMPRGPGSEIVDFALGSLIKDNSTQRTVLNVLRLALQKCFPKTNVDTDHFRANGSGFQYAWDISGSAVGILPSSLDLKNHWLKTSVHLTLYSTRIEQGAEVDRLMIDVPDGYLLKWPDVSSNPPPDALIHEAHLDATGNSPLRSFEVLTRIQRAIATRFQQMWDGTVK